MKDLNFIEFVYCMVLCQKQLFLKPHPMHEDIIPRRINLGGTKVHGNFLEVILQYLVNVRGPIVDTLQEHGEEVPVVVKDPKVIIPYKVRGPQYVETQKEEPFVLTQLAFNKRPSQDESDNSYGDCCWKKVRPFLENQGDFNSHMEILASSSTTPPAIKKVTT